MAKLDLDSYFSRIGYTGPREPSLAVLRSLQALHPAAIPFENLDVIRRVAIRLDLPSIEKKLVRDRRGGYCFEQNALFAAVLEELGFEVTPLAARVRWQVPSQTQTALTHMVLRVDVERAPYLADVGFGGQTPTGPLRLDVPDAQRTPHETFRITRTGERYALQIQLPDGYSDLYVFTLERQYLVDFELGNWFTSTHPTSHFVQNLTLARAGPEGERISLFNRELVIRRGSEAEKRNLQTPEELLEVLASHFGLHFPAGTRFGSPGAPWPS